MKQNVCHMHVVFLACIIGVFPACMHRPRVVKKRIVVEQHHLDHSNTFTIVDTTSTPTITVWIHGTRFLNHSFYNEAFKDAPCLKHISVCLQSNDWLCEMAHNLSAYNPAHTYIFGWSGKLSAREREIAAKALYKDLVLLCQYYRDLYQTEPYIRMITHSHGGNVALNLAQMQETDSPISIQELILLACPVQKQTMNYVKDPLFKKVYSLHSSLDLVQIIAPQIMCHTKRDKKGNLVPALKIPILSARYFPPNERLLQAKIKLNGRAILHSEFTSKRFISVLSKIVTELENPLSHASPVPYQLISTYIT